MPNQSSPRITSPWLLTLPSLLLFVGLLAVPLSLLIILSFNAFEGMQGIQDVFTPNNYLEILTDVYFYELFARTAGMALGVTIICILLGVPETIILGRMRSSLQGLFFVVILGPLLISVVVRTLGWQILLGRQGPLNSILMWVGVVDAPVQFLFSMTGIVIVLTHVLLPFMVIAVWSAQHKLDPQVENAARSLGAGPMTTFRRVTLPQLMPGILSGGLIVFTLSASAFATPAIIGGRRVKVVTTAIYDEFLTSLNWPLGAAISMLLLIGIAAIVIGSNRLIERRFKQVFT
ncbi:ABC transporter permease [Roseobacter sp. GAI101]|uniref:ABC transporter permease n=1 Tax=Roseobacter sp. (strain GAI101) TaxID=391589 RepID=UPI0002F9F8FB|nr:ABC transporter permease [Roseobacter sp. GAI101]